MTENPFSRTALLLGQEGLETLKRSRVAVFGVGGVGGYVVEALARSGVGALDLIDNDTVSLTNLNRQIIALHSTLGKAKVEVAKARCLDINPDIQVRTWQCFYLPETAGQFDFTQYDYIVDAIDTVSGKVQLVVQAIQCGTPIISSMGAGNKLDPTKFQVADLSKTQVCPLARAMRTQLRKRGIHHLKVVYSTELPVPHQEECQEDPGQRRSLPGSIAFVPSVAGLILAGEVIRDLVAEGKKQKQEETS